MIKGVTPAIQYGRDTEGRAVLKAQNADNVRFSGLGTITGNGEIRIGGTNDEANSNYTQFTFTHEDDSENLLILDNKQGMHYNLVGENINVTTRGGNAERTIQVDANNSNIDLGNSAGSQYVIMTAKTKDNKVTLGTGNDEYFDSGKFNHAKATGGANRMETTAESHGAVMVGGAGDDTFLVGGKFGVIDGGNGTNTFEGLGVFGENPNSSYRNVFIGGSGNDKLIDNGGYNIFFGGGGNDTAEIFGTGNISQIGTTNGEAEGTFGSSAIKSYIFSGTEMTDKKTGKTYNIYDIMTKYGWTLNEFLHVCSEISPNEPDSLGNHDVIDEETMKKLQTYFANNLTLEK